MWKYKDKVINSIEDMPDGTVGFIYEVRHIPTGKKYIGKKILHYERNVRIGKRDLKRLKEERKAQGIGGRLPAKKKIIKESDWKDYYGSSEVIKQMVSRGKPEEFEREILQFVPSKKLMTYYETKLLFELEVLESENEYINDNILAKFFRRDFDIE